MRIFSRLTLLSVIMAAMMLPGIAHAKTRVLVNCFWPPQLYVCTQILPTWGEWVKVATEGRATIQIPPKSLASPPEQWGSVENMVWEGINATVNLTAGQATITIGVHRHTAAECAASMLGYCQYADRNIDVIMLHPNRSDIDNR